MNYQHIFSQNFLEKYKKSPILENIINRLEKGETVNTIIEYLVEQHIKDTEILVEYYHPKQK